MFVAYHAVELDGRLVAQGRRLRDLTACEMLSWGYSLMVENLDRDKRRDLDHALQPDEEVRVDDAILPPELRGQRPPSWWK